MSFGGWGRGGGVGGGASPTGASSTENGDGGFLEDPFDQQPATDAPAEWEGGGAWDEANATAEGEGGFGQDASGFGGERKPVIAYPPPGAGRPAMPLPGQQMPPQVGVGEQPPQGPPVDEAEVRRRLGMGVCAIEALVHGVQGAVIGSIFGIFGGVSEGMSAGARGKPLVQHVLLRARGSAASFGSWIGVYQGAKCSMMVARGGKKDAFNAFMAGFAAGAVPALPTRNPRVILFSALGSAGLMGSIEAAGAFFGGGGH